MREDLDPLIFDFLEWLAREPQPYAVVLERWKTSCPRLTIWEDAVDRDFVVRRHRRGEAQMIGISHTGRAFLESYRPRKERTDRPNPRSA